MADPKKPRKRKAATPPPAAGPVELPPEPAARPTGPEAAPAAAPPAPEAPPAADDFTPPPPADAGRGGLATRRWRVSLPGGQPSTVVEAADEDEAFVRYKAANGITDTDHQPAV